MCIASVPPCASATFATSSARARPSRPAAWHTAAQQWWLIGLVSCGRHCSRQQVLARGEQEPLRVSLTLTSRPSEPRECVDVPIRGLDWSDEAYGDGREEKHAADDGVHVRDGEAPKRLAPGAGAPTAGSEMTAVLWCPRTITCHPHTISASAHHVHTCPRADTNEHPAKHHGERFVHH